jgi:4-oxalocrotonate tautomerase
MPIITVSLYTGRTQKEKDRLAEAITEVVVKILNVAKKDIVIVFQEASLLPPLIGFPHLSQRMRL